MAERLDAMPTEGLALEGPVSIRWNDHQVPFIRATSDSDAAYAVGLVHAHLRLGQIAVMRRVVEGRLSESVGPLTTDIDAALRVFNFYRAADDVYAAMPPESREWLERYAQGVNDYAARLSRSALPHEMRLLDIPWTPWRPQDSIAIGRAVGVDINWGAMLTLLGTKDTQLRDAAMRRVLGYGARAKTSFEPARPAAKLETLRKFAHVMTMLGKSGSNSIVVSAQKTGTGSAMIANDPHLGFTIPNAWIIVGIDSPSYRIAGMMVPGTPTIGFGRNEQLAWGGTNLRAATSDFVDVSGLPEDAFTVQSHEIGVRFWFNKDITARMSPYGPVMSDLDTFGEEGDAFAIRWVGHQPTDEISALLQAMKASSFGEFRAAMEHFAVPPQTFLVAEAAGNIGGMIGTTVPARRPEDRIKLMRTPEESDAMWQGLVPGPNLPFSYNPETGFLASGNNRPSTQRRYLVDGFFPQDERIRRLTQLLADHDGITLEDLKAIQQDTVSLLSREVVDAVRGPLTNWSARSPDEAAAIDALLSWDGDYSQDSAAPLIFEAFFADFAPAVYAALGRSSDGALYDDLNYGLAFLKEDVSALEGDQWADALGAGLARAANAAASDQSWGDVHRLKIQHVLGGLPLIGSRYPLGDYPVSGSRETIQKTAHGLGDTRHNAFYGAQSRHLSDMSDIDANYFVLLGGQDGWIRSDTSLDQVALWREGRYIHVPLSPEGVNAAFPIEMQLTGR